MHCIRLAVRENRLTSAVITEGDYVPAIEDTGRGWVAEDDGAVVGFAIGNRITGNIWALFVDPAHEGRGHERRLHDAMVEWLFTQRVPRLWLSTNPDTRAQAFYVAAGWKFLGMLASGEAHYELRRPALTVRPAPILVSTLTCPDCGFADTEVMPTDACLYFYECKGCQKLLRPKPGDCCVFCSFGSVRCPPAQLAHDCCDNASSKRC